MGGNSTDFFKECVTIQISVQCIGIPNVVGTLLRQWLADCKHLFQVTLCSICGSDLHPFHGRETGIVKGTVVGHEFVGIVHALGPKVGCGQQPVRIDSGLCNRRHR